MTQEQHKLFSEACTAFGEALEKIFSTEAPTMERNIAMDFSSGKSQTVSSMFTKKGWVDVPTKDWEIVEYKEKNGPGIIDASLLSTSHLPQYDIRKVRRLSDNTVWTVGDIVTASKNRDIIKEFEIIDGKMFLKMGYGIGFTLTDIQLSEIEPALKPLFTTADGVDVFEGDKFWYWYDDGRVKEIDTAFHEWQGWTVRRHSTREAAEKAYSEWLFDQPVLTLSDLEFKGLTGKHWDELKRIVKDKIAKR